jgi:luciferase family oxidoreductase group 1
MLPNHAPLTIAEQFGTLETLHPGRIDLGVGRAPGSDRNTMRALRRDDRAAETFPSDVVELQGYLTGHTRIPGVHATPGRDTNVPVYILGSSLFGAVLAASLGLPYAFASHFAPGSLREAVATYRREFQPSEQLAEPYVIAGVNVIAADTDQDAQDQLRVVSRARVVALLGGGRGCSDEEADALLASPQGRYVAEMMRYSAVGDGHSVADYLDAFTAHADADELIVVHPSPTLDAKLRSLELLADATGLRPRSERPTRPVVEPQTAA